MFNNTIAPSIPVGIGKLTELVEVNLAANKIAMLNDKHFEGWSKVTTLNLNDNNLVACGSLAPLKALAELRIFGNQLPAMPALGVHDDLTIFEIHKNRITEVPDDYFDATKKLERLSIWKNELTTLPSSLVKLDHLVGVQAHENPITSVPDGPWPEKLETLFLQDTKLTSLPGTLASAKALKRLNIKGVGCDDELAKKLEALVLDKKDAIFWDKTGKMTRT